MRIVLASLVVVGFAAAAFADTPAGGPPPAPPAAGTPGARAATPPVAPPGGPVAAPRQFPPPAPPSIQCATGRRAWIPGWTEQVTREQVTPACFEERCVPQYTTVTEIVRQKVCRPKVVHVEVPVYGLKPVPVYETRKTPICGNVTVPVYASRRVPVMGWGIDCDCKEVDVPVFWRTEQVQCGVRQERRVLGYKTEKVQVGVVNQKCQIGTRIEDRTCGTEETEVLVGTREVRRVCGQVTEAVMVCPPVTKQVTVPVAHPGRWVTVGEAGSVPITGTEAVMTEAEYRAAVDFASARP
jgi:hypothetical protein